MTRLSDALSRLCIYCGRTPRNGSLACHAHSDLLQVDPAFAPDVPQKPDRRTPTRNAPAGLITQQGG